MKIIPDFIYKSKDVIPANPISVIIIIEDIEYEGYYSYVLHQWRYWESPESSYSVDLNVNFKWRYADNA